MKSIKVGDWSKSEKILDDNKELKEVSDITKASIDNQLKINELHNFRNKLIGHMHELEDELTCLLVGKPKEFGYGFDIKTLETYIAEQKKEINDINKKLGYDEGYFLETKHASEWAKHLARLAGFDCVDDMKSPIKTKIVKFEDDY